MVSWPPLPDPTIRPPLDPSYAHCPQCGKPCVETCGDPLDAATARILKLWAEFDRFYTNRQTLPVSSEAA